MRPFVLTASTCLLIAAGAAFSALSAAPLTIESLRTENYPVVELRFRAEAAASGEAPVYRVSERHGDQERSITERAVAERSDASPLYMALVLDATRSVSPASYKKLQRFALALLGELKDPDQAALYVIGARAREASLFTRDLQRVRTALRGVERSGRRTRIYDALYLAMKACAAQPIQIGQGRCVVVTLSDARDEDSLLTDRDSYELNALRGPRDLSVYTYLFGRRGDSRGLERLAIKTGGDLVQSPAIDSAAAAVGAMRRLSVLQYVVRYESPSAGGSLAPGDSVLVRVRSPISEDEATQSYQAPFGYWLRSISPLAVAFLIGLSCLLVGLFVLLLMLLWQLYLRRKTGGSGAEEGSAVERADAAKQAGIASNGSAGSEAGADVVAVVSPSPAHPVSDPDLAAYLVSADERAESRLPISEESIERAVHPEAREVAGMLLSDDRRLYLREYGYQLTQSAWREAGDYRRARLERVAQGGWPARDYDLFLESTVIGSGRWSHIPLRDASASAVHAKIKRHDGRYLVFDLLSAAGVAINGRKLLRPRGLVDGDELRIGRTRFVFRGES